MLGLPFMTLRPHSVSLATKSASPDGAVDVLAPSYVGPTDVVGPTSLKNLMHLQAIVLMFPRVSSSGMSVSGLTYARSPDLRHAS